MSDVRPALSEFGDELRRLRSLAGSPSLNQLVEHSAGLPWPLRRSTISDKINGRSLPDWNFVVSFVRACQAYAEKATAPLHPHDVDLARWDSLHLRAMRTIDESRGERRIMRAVQRETARRPFRTDIAPVGPAPAIVPRQLPIAPRTFSGRGSELAALTAIAGATVESAALVTIDGMAGVGKTTLAVWWGHQHADSFPDGQIYQDLRGFAATGSPMSPVEALRTLLEALAVQPARIPTTLDAMVGLYRTLLAGRRILVILDNARDDEQVRPLLPGDPTVVTVVTSRAPLTSLVATHGARPLTLAPLSPADARVLLTDRLGDDRSADATAAVDEIIESCARLPLALSIVAARAATYPNLALAAMASELRNNATRLDALDAGNPVADVRSAFSWSYQQLSDPAARLFRLLGLHPGPDLDTSTAARLAGRPTVTRDLAELTRVHLVTESASGRYALHDLLHAYADELARTHDGQAQRRDAARRMLEHYVRTAQSAACLLSPRREAVAGDDAATAGFADHDDALRWFTIERPALLGAVALAAEWGLTELACQLAWTVSGLLDLGGRWQERAQVQQTALAAAEGAGDRPWQARIHRDLTIALALQDQLDQSLAHAESALRIDADLGDEYGQARTHSAICLLMERWDRHPDALRHAHISLDLFLRTDNTIAQAYAFNTVGWYQTLVGSHRDALANCHRAVDLLSQLGDHGGEATAWDSLGHAHHHLGDHTEAIRCYERAIELIHHVGNRYFEARALDHLGDAHHARGDDVHARRAWHHSLTLMTEVQPSEAEAVRAKLDRADRLGVGNSR
jgi:tetratricopeptide (TPR) repeat protein